MKCAIHQPQFIPYLGYFHKIAQADVFVFLDNVQFKKNEFQNRNKMMISGVPAWLTVPVAFTFGDTLRQTRIAQMPGWREKLMKTLEHNYSHTPFFAEFGPGFRALLERAWNNLAELNAASVLWLMHAFGIGTPTVTASDMPDLDPHPTGRLLDICRRLGADTYLSGAGGRDYLDTGRFEAAGLALEFQHFVHPEYPQHSRKNDPAFAPYLSALDGLFNCGGGEAACRQLNLSRASREGTGKCEHER